MVVYSHHTGHRMTSNLMADEGFEVQIRQPCNQGSPQIVDMAWCDSCWQRAALKECEQCIIHAAPIYRLPFTTRRRKNVTRAASDRPNFLENFYCLWRKVNEMCFTHFCPARRDSPQSR